MRKNNGKLKGYGSCAAAWLAGLSRSPQDRAEPPPAEEHAVNYLKNPLRAFLRRSRPEKCDFRTAHGGFAAAPPEIQAAIETISISDCDCEMASTPENAGEPIPHSVGGSSGQINQAINRLLHFALQQGLIAESEYTYAANRLIGALGLPCFCREPVAETLDTPEPPLEKLLDFAVRTGRITDSPAQRDLFDTLLMDCLMPRPAEVIRRFYDLHAASPEAATDYFYRLGIASNYIRKARTDKDIRWRHATAYGELDVTINMAKPEKDPRDIAGAAGTPASGYPACQLCRENEGFYGDGTHQARQTLRLIPLHLSGTLWYLQYSPYIYYNEHCIILKKDHTPMRINAETFTNLFEALDFLPHYTVGSNADLPLVGGSILSHDHYQGGRHAFPMAAASVEKDYCPSRAASWLEGCECGRLTWPLSVLRLRGDDSARLAAAGTHIANAWRAYSDPGADILASSGDTPHNTVTPIARKNSGRYELDLVLRNNRADARFPDGIFHPHKELHHIKKENIGLIEVMGLLILPSRLAGELEDIRRALASGEPDIDSRPGLGVHAEWYRELREKLAGMPENELEEALRREVGEKCLRVLLDAGVFKRNNHGMAAFDRFAASLGLG